MKPLKQCTSQPVAGGLMSAPSRPASAPATAATIASGAVASRSTTGASQPARIAQAGSQRSQSATRVAICRALSSSQDSLIDSKEDQRLRQVLTPASRPVTSGLRLRQEGVVQPKKPASIRSGVTAASRKLSVKVGAVMRKATSKDSINSCGVEKENIASKGQLQQRIPSSLLHKGCSGLSVLQLEKDKINMEQQISELVRNAESKKAEIATLKMEIKRLKEKPSLEEVDQLRQQLETLSGENRSLKERLLDMGVPIEQTSLSDSEKEQLLLRRSASGSMASLDSERKDSCQCGLSGGSGHRADSSEPLLEGGGDLDLGGPSCVSGGAGSRGDDPSCPPEGEGDGGRPEWDKASNSSISEMSVACLQDRIMQMEETHYSTNEELQATLQELTDLQDQLTDLQLDNERMGEEKSVLLESLCSQTEKLEECRSQILHLKSLLLQHFEEGTSSDISLSASDREFHYVHLLRNAQDEQENLLQRQDELSASLQATKDQSLASVNEFFLLKERVRLLESTVESVHADKRLLEGQLAEAQETIAAQQINASQLRLQLDNEQQKVLELQREREASASSELESLLQETRSDKERTEERSVQLQEQLSLSQREAARLREQLSQLQEDSMVSKNNARKQVSDLEYLVTQLEAGKVSLLKEQELVGEALHLAEGKCQRHLEDKRELRASLGEMRLALAERQSQVNELQKEVQAGKDTLASQTEEWQRFQCDLLTSVRVANDFRTEAQLDLEKIMTENKQMKDRVEALQGDLSRLKEKQQQDTLTVVSASPIGHVMPMHRGSPIRTLTPDPSTGDLTTTTTAAAAAAAVVASASTAARRQMGTAAKLGATQLSVKTLIESIENATKQAKEHGLSSSRSSSTSSLNSIASESRPVSGTTSSNSLILSSSAAGDLFIKPSLRSSMSDVPASILRDGNSSKAQQLGTNGTGLGPGARFQSCRTSYTEGGKGSSPGSEVVSKAEHLETSVKPHPVSILAAKLEPMRRNSYGDLVEKKDPLSALVKGGGSKRNALLKWCQNKTVGYKAIDITNFSSSWNDGLAFCALLHSYLPDQVSYHDLDNKDKRRNFTIAFQAAEAVGIATTLNVTDLISQERPDWQSIMTYVTSIYKHFET